jgi:hypothetical protein
MATRRTDGGLTKSFKLTSPFQVILPHDLKHDQWNCQIELSDLDFELVEAVGAFGLPFEGHTLK